MATITRRKVKGGIRFTAQVRRKGVSESKTFSNIARARLWAAQRESELTDIAEGQIPRKTLGEAFERYSKEVSPGKRGGRWERIRLESLPTTAGCILRASTPLQSCHPALLAQWRDQRLAEEYGDPPRKIGAGTVLRELGLLSAVFQRCVREWGWMRENPVKAIAKPAAPAHRDKVLSWQEVRGVLRSLMGTQRHSERKPISYRVGLAFLFALRTGMRAGEICGIKRNDVHADHVTLPLTKNGTSRSVPLSSKGQKILARCLNANLEPVFGLTPARLDALFRKARDRAGLVNVRFHDARHTYATRLASRMVELGISFPEFLQIFGWKDPKYAMIYVNSKASDIAQKLG